MPLSHCGLPSQIKAGNINNIRNISVYILVILIVGYVCRVWLHGCAASIYLAPSVPGLPAQVEIAMTTSDSLPTLSFFHSTGDEVRLPRASSALHVHLLPAEELGMPGGEDVLRWSPKSRSMRR